MKQGLSWLSSLLMDFGLASVMFVRCESSVSWSLSQSPGFEGEEDNQEFIEQTAFRETHEKNHATLAKFATTARESQMKAFFTGIRTIALTSHTTNVPFRNPSRSLSVKGDDTQSKPGTRANHWIVGLCHNILIEPRQIIENYFMIDCHTHPTGSPISLFGKGLP